MSALVSWFINSRIGQWLAAVGALISFVVLAYFRGRSEGKEDERNKAAAQSLENLRSRSETNAEIDKMSTPAQRKHLSRWVQDDTERL